jgi:CSLREA domain-containing protein
MNALSLRFRYACAPVSLLLIFVLGCVISHSTCAKAQRTTAVEPLGASHSLHLQFPGEQPRPLSMATGDFDEDGVNDLVIGYALAKGGSITVLRGNLDALAPQTHESWLAAGRHEYSDPYLQNSEPITVDSRPSLMTAADVNGDGHLDLVFATKGGNQLFALFGDGKGNFLSPVSTTVDGAVTALAAYRPGVPFMGEVVVLGQQSNAGAKLSVLSYSSNTWTTQASYPLPGPATAMTVANLDADSIPDTAIVTGGQLLILHGKAALSGQNALTTVPGSDVESVTAGSFLFDRRGLLQLSVLTSSGDVVTLAHEGFDSRPYTTQELAQSRRGQHANAQALSQQTSDTGDAPWIEVERKSIAGAFAPSGPAPILLRSRASGTGGDDLVILNSPEQQQTLVSHSFASSSRNLLSAAASPSNRITTSSLTSSDIVAAISTPVSPDTRQGLVMLSANSLSPEVSFATTGNTYYVNTTVDNTGTSTDPDDGTRCTQESGEICTLRDAISFANGDGPSNISGGESDTIMLPTGTYVLSQQAGSFDTNGNALTHLEILGPMSIVGASSSSTIIDGGAHDQVFTINGGPFSSAVLNPSGTSYVFDVAFSNLTVQNGKNVNSGGTNSVGGCINWDAFGNGNLTITNSVIQNCSSPVSDGGGVWATSTDHGNGTLTLSQDQFLNNSTQNLGGGLQIATSSLPDSSEATPNLSASNTTFSQNSAPFGGGLSIEEPASTTAKTFTLATVTVNNNQALSGGTGAGGEVGNDGSGTLLASLLIQTSSFADNSASGGLGGGLHINSPGTTTTITGSNFQGNSAGTGGAIAVDNDFGGKSNTLQISLSRIAGNTATNGSGISGGDPGSPSGSGAGKITATENWWGCNGGPGATGCDRTAQFNVASGDSLITNPYAVLSLSASPTSVNQGDSITLTAGITKDNNGSLISGAFPGVQSLTPTYSTNVAGDTIASQPFSSAGVSTATLTPSSASSNTASVMFDSQSLSTGYTVNSSITTSLSITAPSITFGQTASISVALLPSKATGITAADFTAFIDSTPLTITSTATPNVFTLSGPTLASLNAGSHPVQVNFIGITGYSPTGASTSLQVSKATATVTLGNLTATYDGTAHGVTATTSPVGLAVSFTYNGSSAAPSNAGSYTVVGTINDTNYTGTATGQLVISKTTATVTLGNLAQTYNGTAHAATAITTPAGLAVDFTYNGIPTAPTAAGSYTVVGTINDTNYAGSASAQLVISQATLNLAWTPTSPIVYGTALSPAQFNATATFNSNPVAGTFSYSSSIGTVLGAGMHTLTVSFTPSDTTDFSTPAPITANITVTQAAPVLAWSPSSPIVYGTPLSPTQFNATATFNLAPIAGTFSYSAPIGTVLGAGIHTLTVSFTPSDTTDYSTPALIPANITVTPATPVISWSPSSPIAYGTALTAAQLNATVSNNGSAVAGTFNYSPALGTVLTAGTHTLTYTFTPSDTTDYNTPAPITRNITVSQGTPILAWSSPSPIVSGTALSATQLNATASYNGTAVAGTFSYNPALGTVLSAGTHTLTATFTPSDTTDYSTPAPITTNLTVQAIPVLAWTPTSPIVYGTALSPAQFNATATYSGNPVAGTFSYSSAIGTILGAGTHTLTVTFTPSDTTTYSTPTPITANIAVTAATPVLGWLAPASITYGTALTGTQLNATATYNGNPVAGVFTYTTGSGTVLSVGMHTLTASFIPNDTTDYNTPAGTVSTTIMVVPATPTLQWATPAPIPYGTALTGTQLSATATYNANPVAGAFAYTPALGTVLSVGSHTLSATFIPSDTTDYNTPTGTVSTTITVTAVTPMLQWATPTSITYGTALTNSQLNATASYNGSQVPGSFTYNPGPGTVLGPGTHTLSVSFTPTDTTTYGTPTAITTNLTVTQATLTVTANNATRVYGTANPVFTGAITGELPGDSFTESFATAASTASPVGTYAITPTVTGANLALYKQAITDGTLTITQAATKTSLSVSSVSITPGQSVTLTAQVASATIGTPTGNVQFYDGSTLLGTSVLSDGSSSYSTGALSPGVTHTLTAVYMGDSNFTGSSGQSPATVAVPVLDFSLTTLGPATATVAPGGTISFLFTISPIYGSYPTAVTFTVTGLPPGATYTTSPAMLAPNAGPQAFTVSIQTASTTAASDRTLLNGGGKAFALALLLLPFAGVRRLRRSGRLAVLLLAIAGFAGTAGLIGCGASNSFSGQTKSYTVTVTATAGTVQHTSTVTLNLQ